jgi:hypothetical protein
MKLLAIRHVSEITDFCVDSGKHFSFKLPSSLVRLPGIMAKYSISFINFGIKLITYKMNTDNNS